MTNDTAITITLTRIDLCNLALACTNARQHAGDATGASKWTLLHDTIMAEIIAADEADQEAQEAPETAPAAEAEQQPTETENAPQAATQAAEGTAQQADDITAAIIGAIGAPAPAQTITATLIGPDGTPYRATYSADLLDSLRTEARVLDIQDDTTGELVYIKPDDEEPAETETAEEPETVTAMWQAIHEADAELQRVHDPAYIQAQVDAMTWHTPAVDWTARIDAAMKAVGM